MKSLKIILISTILLLTSNAIDLKSQTLQVLGGPYNEGTNPNVRGKRSESARAQYHTLGINLLQIPASTIDVTYEFSHTPRLTIIANPGYTFNYARSFDFTGFLLSPHYKCGNDGYSVKKQSGGFLKVGMKLNFRKHIEKTNYFFLGAFITNSLLHEKAEYQNQEIPDSGMEYLKHNLFIYGLTGALGYNFRISNRLSSDLGVHISLPSKKYKDLYGYTNYIPGMGYMETCGNGKIFPMVSLNLKYR